MKNHVNNLLNAALHARGLDLDGFQPHPVIQDAFTGTSGPDTLNGTANGDSFNIEQGGNDTVNGKAGNDNVYVGGALTAADKIDGGTDTGGDTVELSGDYTAGVVFGANTITNVETLIMRGPFSFDITMNDGNVAAGKVLQVMANIQPASGGTVAFDGSAETDGSFIIQGNVNKDVLTGGQSSDVINSGGGNDTIDGQGGIDRLSFANSQTAVTVDLNVTAVQNTGYGKLKIANIENITGSTGADTLTGDGNANAFFGNGGNDIIAMKGGDDFVEAGANPSDSRIDGGTGTDLVSFYFGFHDPSGATGVTVDLGITGSQNTGGGTFTLSNFENLQGSFWNDTLTGDDGSNVIYGADGDDVLNGAAGNDTLYGDKYVSVVDLTRNVLPGVSTMRGNGVDTAAYVIDTQSAGTDMLNGGAGDDTIYLGPGKDIASGGLGNDTLVLNGVLDSGSSADGGAGNDTFQIGGTLSSGVGITGGAGNDTFQINGTLNPGSSIDGGAGTDMIVFSGNANLSGVTLTSIEALKFKGSGTISFAPGNDLVASGATLTVDGSKMSGDGVLRFDGSVETDGKFVIIGGAGDDELKGGAGNDTFTGGAGSDSLTGGGGKDTFVFAKAADATSTSFDSITDFDANVDKIDLSFKVTGIDAKITSGSLGFATFDADLAKAAKPAKLAAHHAVLFNPDDGEGAGHNLLIVDVNGQAGYQAGKDLVLILDGGTHLANLDVSDFI